MKWSLVLVLYKFILDSTFHFNHDFEQTNILFKELFAILLLPAFEVTESSKHAIRAILTCSIPAILLGILQINNPYINLDNLIPNNSIFFTEKITASYLMAENRIVGTFNIAIGFALFTGILCIICWSKYFMNENMPKRVFASISFLMLSFLIIFTQTRSAIYGVIPSIILAYILSGENVLKKVAIASAISVLFLLMFGSIQTFVLRQSERSALKLDANTYYKITANIYGTYGALSENFFFGIKKSRSLQDSKEQYLKDYRRDLELIKKGKSELGNILKIKDSFKLAQTHHNLYAFYLRYYGTIGFFLLMIVLIKIYKKILAKKNVTDRYMLFGVFIFILQYALLHNNKLLEFPLFWILLSYGEENERTLSSHERVQRKTNSI